MERFLYRCGIAVLTCGLILLFGALCSCANVNTVRVLDLSGSAGAETLSISTVDLRTGRTYEGSVELAGSGSGLVAAGPVAAVVFVDAGGMHVGAAWPKVKVK